MTDATNTEVTTSTIPDGVALPTDRLPKKDDLIFVVWKGKTYSTSRRQADNFELGRALFQGDIATALEHALGEKQFAQWLEDVRDEDGFVSIEDNSPFMQKVVEALHAGN